MLQQSQLTHQHELREDQLKGIRKGLYQDDVVGLTYWQVNALISLKSQGLSAAHLRGKEWFGHEHCYALIHLMTERGANNLSATAAMTELDGLSETQAEGIRNGLTRIDVDGSTCWQINALTKLKTQGLTAAHLCGKEWFDHEHCYALIHLMMERRFSVEEAFTELDGMNKHQAGGIRKGLTRSEVLGLNYDQINSLVKLKLKGLTTTHVRSIQEFTSTHTDALVHLMTERGANNLSAEAALAEINGLSEKKIHQRHTQTFLGLTSYQFTAYVQLKPKGLTIAHLLGKQWFKSGAHYKALRHLMTQRSDNNLSADDAMVELDGLNKEQAMQIIQGLNRTDVLKVTSQQLTTPHP